MFGCRITCAVQRQFMIVCFLIFLGGQSHCTEITVSLSACMLPYSGNTCSDGLSLGFTHCTVIVQIVSKMW